MTDKSMQVRAESKKAVSPASKGVESPLISLRREINRVFDNFWQGTDLWPFSKEDKELLDFRPGVDVLDTEKEFRVKAELPGMDEKDVHVSLAQNTLTIKGEKKEETEDKGKDYYQMERHWGSFYRSIPLPGGVEASKADAVFKKGLLTVTLPKTADAKQATKEIPVHA